MGRGVSISIISTTMVPTPARRRAIPPTQTDRGSAGRHPNHRRSWSCRSGPVASRADAARGPRETGQRVSLANETLSPRWYNRTLASRPVPHAAKQARFNADADRCTQNTRMGLSPAWPFTAAAAASLPGEPRWCGSPCPICVFCVDLPASALNPCLLRRVPHAAVTNPGRRSRQNQRQRPHAPVPTARPAWTTVSPKVQRHDGETRPGSRRFVICNDRYPWCLLLAFL